MSEVVYCRKQFLDRSKNPPEFVDDKIPTEPVRIFKQGRPSSLGTWLIGSYYVGSNQVLQITFEDFNTNSANVYWRLYHSRDGTLDIPYLESAGQETRIGALTSPLESVGPGTFRVDLLGPGSPDGNFAGAGSQGVNVFSAKILGYII
jgi:hypothetical protein